MDSPNKNSSKSALLPQDETKTPPPTQKKKKKTKQNQKRKKETKTKINWRNREKRANCSKPKTFSREKKSNPIGEIERRNQITQSSKRFLEIEQEEEEEAEEKMRMKKEDQEQEDGCCWFCKETMRGTFLSQIMMDQLDTRKSDGYFFQCGYSR
jgi:hypothetical protein